MPLPLLIPLAVGALAANFLSGRARAQREQLTMGRKEELASEKAFIKVLDDLSSGKRGEHDVNAIIGLEKQIKGLPGGGDLFDTVLSSAKAGQMHQQSMQGIVQALFGGPGQGDVPPATGGGTPGLLPLAGPSAPPSTSPQADLEGVSRQIATMNQVPLLQRTPQQVEQRGQLIDEESRLTDLALAPTPFPNAIGKTTAGRVLYQDPRTGEKFSEKTITIEDSRINGGKPTNIPSVFGGRQLADEEAIKRIVKHGGKDPETGEVLAPFNSVEEAVASAKQRSQGLIPPQEKEFPLLPGIMKMKGVTTVTIPKDMFGVEIHGSKAEALSGVIGQARQRGFASGEIYDNLKQQGIDPPEALSHQAFNEFAGKFLTSEEFLKSPRKALQEIASRFPSTDPKALTSFGHQAFTAAYVGAKERLRKSGIFVSDRQIAQAALSEATQAVGSEFISESAMQDADRQKTSTTEGLMAELLDKGLAGNAFAMRQYHTLIQMHVGKLSAEQAAKTIAQIKAEQSAAFIQPETLKDIENKGGGSLPFGTTQEQAAGSQIIKPEVQAGRTQRVMETDKMQFAAQRAIPLFSSASARMNDLMDKAAASGFVGKGAASVGLPSQLGQEIKGFDEFKAKFAGNLRALAGETAGVITEGDIDRIMKIFPSGQDFVTLIVDRKEQIIKSLSEVQAILSDRLQTKVEPFKPLIEKLQGQAKSEEQFTTTLDEFEKALKKK